MGTGTTLRLSTARHQQMDGQSERAIQTVEVMLRHYVNYSQNNWADLLPTVEYAYNTSKQASTQRTPFEIEDGENPPHWLATALDLESGPSTVDEKLKRILDIRKEVKETLTRAQAVQKENADRNRRHSSFEVGESVKIAASEINPEGMMHKKKLRQQWYGPFKVIKLVGSSCYQIELPRNVKAHDIFHVSVLEKYTEDDEHPERQAATPQEFPAPEEHRESLQEFINDGAEYILLDILDFRVWKNTKQWLAHYESGAKSWQPLESFVDINGTVTETFVDYTERYTDQLSRDVNYWKKLLGKKTFTAYQELQHKKRRRE